VGGLFTRSNIITYGSQISLYVQTCTVGSIENETALMVECGFEGPLRVKFETGVAHKRRLAGKIALKTRLPGTLQTAGRKYNLLLSVGFYSLKGLTKRRLQF
jgi:hypothetical protein